MNNLFSIFDPQSWMGVSLMWLSLSLPIICLPKNFWATSCRWATSNKLFKNELTTQMASASGAKDSPAKMLFFICVFFWLATSNFLGLFPLVFTPTSHLVISLGLSLPLWTGYVTYCSFKNPSSSLGHLVPSGSPSALSPFMVLIELTSNFIRPITLSVRLAANMVAGHLLLSLLSGSIIGAPVILSSLVVLGLMLLLVLEMGVALIQAYVFTILTCIYLEEVENSFN